MYNFIEDDWGFANTKQFDCNKKALSKSLFYFVILWNPLEVYFITRKSYDIHLKAVNKLCISQIFSLYKLLSLEI